MFHCYCVVFLLSQNIIIYKYKATNYAVGSTPDILAEINQFMYPEQFQDLQRQRRRSFSNGNW